MTAAAGTLPSLFVSHGAPNLIIDRSPAAEAMVALAASLPRPQAVLVISAHWETDQPTLTAAAAPETIHDFYGFPDALYRLRYPAPGDPALAEAIAARLSAAGIECALDATRGLDHGAWVPLMLMYPKADLPVLQLSVQPGRSTRAHSDLGRALAPLRGEGILVLASGGATHNLRALAWRDRFGPPHDAVREFAEWLNRALGEGRIEDLLDYRAKAPAAAFNHPSEEHFLPLLVALGAAGPRLDARRVHASFEFAGLAMDHYRFEAA